MFPEGSCLCLAKSLLLSLRNTIALTNAISAVHFDKMRM